MLARLLRLRRELGLREALLYATDQALARTSGGRVRMIRYAIVAQPVATATPATLRPDGQTQIVDVAADHPLVAGFPRPPQVIAQRYRDGARCLAATHGGRFAGFLWWQLQGYEEDEVHCHYRLFDADRCAWDFDVHVEPAYRLGRTLARLWAAAHARLAADGVAWTFSRIALSNRASLAAHARLGAVECTRATFLRIGPLQLAWLPALRLSWGRHRRPELVLRAPVPVPKREVTHAAAGGPAGAASRSR